MEDINFWYQSLTPNRRQESIRPIFWANRTKSYISRTENWDEYPNGRFGDSRSPAYGELDGYGVWIKQTVRWRPSARFKYTSLTMYSCLQKEDALKLWGHPTTFAEVAKLFSRFCTNDLSALPWSDQAPSVETSFISEQLAKMNELGFLTINSQPTVNGARSDDKIFGWGPSNGYVYQKVNLISFECIF